VTQAPLKPENERRTGRPDAGEPLPPEVVKLLLVCGGEVREVDRSSVAAMEAHEAGDRRARERRFTDRRNTERRATDRRHDERRLPDRSHDERRASSA
jgi:hypothetical protein